MNEWSPGGPLARESVLLAGFSDELSARRGLSAHTARAYISDVLHLVRHVAHHRDMEVGQGSDVDVLLGSAELADLRAWLAAQVDYGLSRTTLARRGAAARTFFTWAVDASYLPRNPAERLASGRVAVTVPAVLSESDVARMLDTA